MSGNEIKHKAEMDWRDLLSRPAKLFGYSYFYFIAVTFAIGYFYISSLTEIGKNSVPPAPPGDSSALVQDIPVQSPRTIPPVDPVKSGVATVAQVARGADLFKANCSSCHGDNGDGSGPTAPTLTPKPRNFKELAGWKNGSKVVQIYKTLQEGIAGSSMASYNYLPPEDRFSLIHYVRSLSAGQPVDSVEELRQLDQTYALSLGMNVAGQIPVKKAMKLMAGEAKGDEKSVSDRLKTALSEEGKGSELFWKSVRDPSRVFTSFLNGGGVPGIDRFIKTVCADPAQFGFKPKVARLSDAEWREMREYILNVAERKER